MDHIPEVLPHDGDSFCEETPQSMAGLEKMKDTEATEVNKKSKCENQNA